MSRLKDRAADTDEQQLKIVTQMTSRLFFHELINFGIPKHITTNSICYCFAKIIELP